MKKILLLLLITFSLLVAQDEVKKAPGFTLEDIDGELVELNDLLGEGPVLVSFWATWCKPCVQELKEYNKIYQEYSEQGFKLVAISVDNEKSVAKVGSYVKSKGFDFTILLDTDNEVKRKYYANIVPFSVLLNSKGEIVYQHSGFKKGDELKVKQIIDDLLKG